MRKNAINLWGWAVSSGTIYCSALQPNCASYFPISIDLTFNFTKEKIGTTYVRCRHPQPSDAF